MMAVAAPLPHGAPEVAPGGPRSNGQTADNGGFSALLEKPPVAAEKEAMDGAPDEEGTAATRTPWSSLHLLLASESADAEPESETPTSAGEDDQAVVDPLALFDRQQAQQALPPLQPSLKDEAANAPILTESSDTPRQEASLAVIKQTGFAAAGEPHASSAQASAAAAQILSTSTPRAVQPRSSDLEDRRDTTAASDTPPAKGPAMAHVEVATKTVAPTREPILGWSPPAEVASQSPDQGSTAAKDDHAGGPGQLSTPASAASVAAPAVALQTATPLALDPAKQPSLVEAARSISEAEVTGQVTGSTETLKLRLNPLHLGMVTAVLHGTGDGLAVELQVETAEAHARLTHEKDLIGKALQEVGVAVDRITVQHVPSSAPASGREAGSNGSFPQPDNGTRHDATPGNRGESGGNHSAPGRDERDGARKPFMGQGQKAGNSRSDDGRYI